jgi:hypothetical protein
VEYFSGFFLQDIIAEIGLSFILTLKLLFFCYIDHILSYIYYNFKSAKCVCGGCSREKARIVRIDDFKLYKVCSVCANSLKASRAYRYDVFEDKK